MEDAEYDNLARLEDTPWWYRGMAAISETLCGRALLRVPAFEALRGTHDLTVHTRQRYTAADLRAKLIRAGFKVQRLTYANFLLAIPIYFVRRRQRSQSKKESSDVELPAALIINTALELLLLGEAFLIRFMDLAFGVS